MMSLSSRRRRSPSLPSYSPSRSRLTATLFALTILLPTAQAYTWTFTSTPKQCGNLTISVSGSDGRPPYRVLILPFGPTPLAGNIEARRIMDMPFPNGGGSVGFQLKYPANSQFVAVVSDANGFGSGGTSVAAQVTSSDDASCFDSKTMVQPDFFFSIEPPNQIVQCTNTRIWWDPSQVQGTPNFLGVIPGGQSFAVPAGEITTVPAQGTGFSWKPPLRGGTTLFLLGGDNRGNGTGGSNLSLVSSGINNDGSCLSANSPSSTPGSPAGGSYPTSTDGGTGGNGGSNGGNGNKSSSNTGAIVGGVLGGVALFIAALLLFWFIRRRRDLKKRSKERPVDLINADEDDGDETHHNGVAGRQNELPQYYQPEPFLVPDPTLPRSSTDTRGDTDVEGRRPMSGGTTMSFYTRATTPDTHSGVGGGSSAEGRRKGGAPRPLRPVNIVQHDDGGPSEPAAREGEGEPETIELPPAYTAVKGPKAAAAGSSTEPAVGA